MNEDSYESGISWKDDAIMYLKVLTIRAFPAGSKNNEKNVTTADLRAEIRTRDLPQACKMKVSPLHRKVR
jgi:hypothetical protein